ncbi:MAG: hypothetical protein ACREGB_04680 [Candidatus Saccharimonadales bacterium]
MANYYSEFKTREDWLKSLKKGDKIGIPGRSLSEGTFQVVTVKRVTPTGRIVVTNQNDHETTFDSTGHYSDGSRWGARLDLQPITQEMVARRLRLNRESVVKHFFEDRPVSALSDQQLAEVYDLFQKLKKEFDPAPKTE